MSGQRTGLIAEAIPGGAIGECLRRVIAAAATRDDATVVQYAAVRLEGERRTLFDVAARATLRALSQAAEHTPEPARRR